MTTYIALLRAVNVAGTGKLAMSELKAMCEAAGFTNVRTYIASGNVVFESKQPAHDVKASLEKKLAAYAGKPVGIAVRSAAEIEEVLKRNPFPNAPPNQCVAIFLDQAPLANALSDVMGKADEQIRIGVREIYVHYKSGIGASKLRIPAAKAGTARNMNTIAKLVEMAEKR
jgi:uncharacterized protein (DUF1697 family)